MGKEIFEEAQTRMNLCEDIKLMMIEQLGLNMNPKFITNDQPIFGRGLELDSIDALELAVGVFDKFEVTVTDDNTTIFSSVNTLADFVSANL